MSGAVPHLPVARRGAVAVLTLDRPAKRNAMSAGMWAALPGVLAGLAADPTGLFGVTPAKVGVVHTPESTRALLELVGPATTRYLLFSGELLDAAEALRRGLVDRVVPAAALETEVLGLAEVLASRSALSQRATKEVIAALLAGRDGQAEAGRWYRETVAAGELAEGVAAFTGRRPPRFPWRS